jgi:hypothetical protein
MIVIHQRFNFSISSDDSLPLPFRVIARSGATWQSLAQTCMSVCGGGKACMQKEREQQHIQIMSRQGGLALIIGIASLRSQ